MGTLENLTEIEILKDKVKTLEKALDKACKRFNKYKICYQASIEHEPLCDKKYKSCDECWKEYLLSEAENDN